MLFRSLSDTLGYSRTTSTVIGTVSCFLLRTLSIRFNWRTSPIRSAREE